MRKVCHVVSLALFLVLPALSYGQDAAQKNSLTPTEENRALGLLTRPNQCVNCVNVSTGCCKTSLKLIAGGSEQRNELPKTVQLFGGWSPVGARNVEVTVFDAAGKAQDPKKWSLSEDDNALNVNLNGLPSQQYTVKIRAGALIEIYSADAGGTPPQLLSRWTVNPDPYRRVWCHGKLVEKKEDCPDGNGDSFIFAIFERNPVAQWNPPSTPAKPLINQEALTGIFRQLAPDQSTVLIAADKRGNMKLIGSASECPVGSFLMVYKWQE